MQALAALSGSDALRARLTLIAVTIMAKQHEEFVMAAADTGTPWAADTFAAALDGIFGALSGPAPELRDDRPDSTAGIEWLTADTLTCDAAPPAPALLPACQRIATPALSVLSRAAAALVAVRAYDAGVTMLYGCVCAAIFCSDSDGLLSDVWVPYVARALVRLAMAHAEQPLLGWPLLLSFLPQSPLSSMSSLWLHVAAEADSMACMYTCLRTLLRMSAIVLFSSCVVLIALLFR